MYMRCVCKVYIGVYNVYMGVHKVYMAVYMGVHKVYMAVYGCLVYTHSVILVIQAI